MHVCMYLCMYLFVCIQQTYFYVIVLFIVYENLMARKLSPVGDLERYNWILDLAKAEKRITSDDQVDSLVVKREVLRFVMSVEELLEYFQQLDSKNKSDLHSMYKMEMAVICLLHLEMRVGENMLTSICQRMINRVSFLCSHIHPSLPFALLLSKL